MPVAITRRTLLRKATLDDAGFMLRLLGEPSWRRFIARHSVTTRQQAAQYINEKMISPYMKLGFGLWVVEMRTTGAAAGICGLVKRDLLDDADLGFAFLERYWGRGYALEACREVLTFAFDKLRLQKILAIANPANARSIGLLDKLGFEYESIFSHPGSAERLLLYSVAAPQLSRAVTLSGRTVP